MAEQRIVGVNDRGARVGQDHPKATLTDAEVLLLLELRSEGFSYRELADKFDVSRECVADLCKGRRRVQIAVRYRVVCVP